MPEHSTTGDIVELLPSIVPLLPILLGAATTQFGIFIETQQSFRDRISLKREALTEQPAGRLTALCNHSRSITVDQVLRGYGREEPDFVGDYVRDTLRVYSVVNRLELLIIWVRIGYSTLFATTAGGLFAFLVVWFCAEWHDWIAIFSVALVFVQIAVISMVRTASHRLEGYEAIA